MFGMIKDWIECVLTSWFMKDTSEASADPVALVLNLYEQSDQYECMICSITSDSLSEPIYAIASSELTKFPEEGSYRLCIAGDGKITLLCTTDPIDDVMFVAGRFIPTSVDVFHIGFSLGSHYSVPSLGRTKEAQKELEKLLTENEEVYMIVTREKGNV